MRKSWFLSVAVCTLAVAIACSKHSSTPTSPTSATAANASANADGSTLKSSAPTPQSPVNNARPEGIGGVTLTVINAGIKYAPGAPVQFTYRFQVFNAAGAMVYQALTPSGATTTSHLVTAQLEGDQAYSWQARVEWQGEPWPWSPRATFIAPQTNGYIRGNELYDPLINGKSIGNVHGSPTFVPGVGLKFNGFTDYVDYQLQQTLTEGEFSVLITGMPGNTDGDKTKLISMGSDYDDIITNERRMTLEKRGDPPGVVAWRFITHDDQVDTEGAERQEVNFNPSLTYFIQASWRNNRFNVLIREGGVGGRQVYNVGKSFKGRAYDHNPHIIYLGAPVGRSGETAASVNEMTIRQVWVSARERPGAANQ
jgi:hypothetical protein